MNRERQVDDLYESVRLTRDPDAFQLIINSVVEDYVLADLRNRFWDGTGEKPWQVVEINRLLTRRKEAPLAAGLGGKEGQLVKPPSLKERIENNLVVFFLATLLSGFLAGIGVYGGALKLVDYATVSNDALRELKDDIAKKRNEITTLEARVKTAEASVADQRWLRIRGVEGLDGSRARLVARVNGHAYSYPSRAVWSRLGPGMPEEDFPLPMDVKAYDISFELLTLAPNNEFRQFQSQEVISVRSWPFESEYKIFALTIGSAGTTRGGDTAPIDNGSVHGVPPVKERQGLARVVFEVR
jgi:hypothetical protein